MKLGVLVKVGGMNGVLDGVGVVVIVGVGVMVGVDVVVPVVVGVGVRLGVRVTIAKGVKIVAGVEEANTTGVHVDVKVGVPEARFIVPGAKRIATNPAQ